MKNYFFLYGLYCWFTFVSLSASHSSDLASSGTKILTVYNFYEEVKPRYSLFCIENQTNLSQVLEGTTFTLEEFNDFDRLLLEFFDNYFIDKDKEALEASDDKKKVVTLMLIGDESLSEEKFEDGNYFFDFFTEINLNDDYFQSIFNAFLFMKSKKTVKKDEDKGRGGLREHSLLSIATSKNIKHGGVESVVQSFDTTVQSTQKIEQERSLIIVEDIDLFAQTKAIFETFKSNDCYTKMILELQEKRRLEKPNETYEEIIVEQTQSVGDLYDYCVFKDDSIDEINEEEEPEPTSSNSIHLLKAQAEEKVLKKAPEKITIEEGLASGFQPSRLIEQQGTGYVYEDKSSIISEGDDEKIEVQLPASTQLQEDESAPMIPLQENIYSKLTQEQRALLLNDYYEEIRKDKRKFALMPDEKKIEAKFLKNAQTVDKNLRQDVSFNDLKKLNFNFYDLPYQKAMNIAFLKGVLSFSGVAFLGILYIKEKFRLPDSSQWVGMFKENLTKKIDSIFVSSLRADKKDLLKRACEGIASHFISRCDGIASFLLLGYAAKKGYDYTLFSKIRENNAFKENIVKD